MDDETIAVEKSSNIKSYSYSPSRDTLTVEFKSGDFYEYAPVPQIVFEQMKAAPSKGSFVQNRLKGYYEGRKVEK